MLTAAGLLIMENKKGSHSSEKADKASDNGPVKKAPPQESPWTY